MYRLFTSLPTVLDTFTIKNQLNLGKYTSSMDGMGHLPRLHPGWGDTPQ